MVAPRKDGDDRPEGSDRPAGGGESQPREAGCLAERLRDVIRGEADGDLLLDREHVGNGIGQWLRALDLQVVGACRADERLKPLLKLNISSGLAEDRLVAQLGQHFDAAEVGLLARCLCVPLVSVRVGKVSKQGSLLCPTSIRGHLDLSLLPSSNMRISFIGDDGYTEKLHVLDNNIDNSDMVIEEISADTSGRSFLLKPRESHTLYFWCSEKSKNHGMDLLTKMKDLMRRKPSLSQLTGIRESRIDSFATHLRTYFLGPSTSGEADPLPFPCEPPASLNALDSETHSSSMFSKSSRWRSTSSHATKAQPFHQVCLSPKPNTFKDGAARSSSSIRNGVKDKLKRRGDNHHSSLLSTSQPSVPVPTLLVLSTSQGEGDSSRGCSRSSLLPPVSQHETTCQSFPLSPLNPLLLNLPPPPITPPCSLFSPYYCWCPPCPCPLQYSVSPAHYPVTFDEPVSLPPLSTMLPATVSPVSLITSSLSLGLPKLLPQSFTALPLPITSLALPTSQQMSTFNPYIADPIVHIPVIGICSSGQGYLVSAAPTISSPVPPLLSSFTNCPLIANTESAVEKSARGTLRMLMASSPVSCYQKQTTFLPEVNRRDDHGESSAVDHGLQATAIKDECVAADDVEAAAICFSSMGMGVGLPQLTSEADICRKGGKLERYGYVDMENHALSSPNAQEDEDGSGERGKW